MDLQLSWAAWLRRRVASRVPATQYAVKVGDLQWVRIPPGQSVARPEATRAMKDRAACVNKSSTRDTRSSTQYAVKVGDLQWVRIPSGQSVARPEATRAAKDRTACVNKSSTRDTGQQTTDLEPLSAANAINS